MYKINGVEFAIQPTRGQWLPRETLGIAGSGHPIYPAVRQFEISWQLLSVSGTYQLQEWYNSVGVTGTVVIDLPRYGGNSYTFQSYSGTVIREPSFSSFFSEHTTDVTLLVTNIRV